MQIHPRNHNVLYVGTVDGVFKSTDGGETWFSVGLDFAGVNGLALDLDNPKVLYASTEASVFKTETGGE